jgi:hypothetical protein
MKTDDEHTILSREVIVFSRLEMKSSMKKIRSQDSCLKKKLQHGKRTLSVYRNRECIELNWKRILLHVVKLLNLYSILKVSTGSN